jgi:CBS domain-containing membrane protein
MAEEERYGLHQRLAERFGEGAGEALYTFVATALAIAVSGFAAFFTGQPLIFPSLGPTVGPTAYLFFESPMSRRASPRNAIIGHLVAILAGALSLALFGLLDNPSVLQEGMTLARVGAATLSTALTGGILLLLRASHPPAGATVLIVSLGLLQRPFELLVVAIGVVILTVVGWAINRLAGVPMPVWSAGD